MKASVVIPAKNERYRIERTIRGLLTQSYSDPIEIIVVDNGEDGTGQFVQNSFPRVHVLFEPHVGTNFARECGRKIATGEVIAFIDGDTIPTPSWLGNGLARLDWSHNAIALTGPYLFHDGHYRHQIYANLQRKYFFPLTKKFFERRRGSLMFGANMFIRREAFEENVIFDTSIVFDGDDVDTAIRLSKLGKILWADNVLVRTSARRFMKEGMVKTLYRHTVAAHAVLRRHQKLVFQEEQISARP